MSEGRRERTQRAYEDAAAIPPASETRIAAMIRSWRVYQAQHPRIFRDEGIDQQSIMRENELIGSFIRDLELLAREAATPAPVVPPSPEDGANRLQGQIRSMFAKADLLDRFAPQPPEKRSRGIYNKFIVRRVDGTDAPGGKHDGCSYYVLDLIHDPHAIPAIRAYAESCRAEYPLLAADLDRLAEPPSGSPSAPEEEA